MIGWPWAYLLAVGLGAYEPTPPIGPGEILEGLWLSSIVGIGCCLLGAWIASGRPSVGSWFDRRHRPIRGQLLATGLVAFGLGLFAAVVRWGASCERTCAGGGGVGAAPGTAATALACGNPCVLSLGDLLVGPSQVGVLALAALVVGLSTSFLFSVVGIVRGGSVRA